MTGPREDITPIFAELAARLGFEVQPTRPSPRPHPGEDDDLVEATDNSLRPDDLALAQPSQDPRWRP